MSSRLDIGSPQARTSEVGETADRAPTRSLKPHRAQGLQRLLVALAMLAVTILFGLAAAASGVAAGELLLFGSVAAVFAVMMTWSPTLATILLLIAMFLRIPTAGLAPVDLFWITFAAVVGASVLWMERNPGRLRGTTAVEWAMGLYVLWNFYSMLAPHKYLATHRPDDVTQVITEPFPVWRFILTGTVIPFTLYLVGRFTFEKANAVRALLWTVMVMAGYSAAVSMLQFWGPAALVWPRYIVDDPGWSGRAVGIFNQPVVNGLILTLGFAVGILLATRRSEPRVLRFVALLTALACGVGIYLTHTRAAWLGAAVVIGLGALLATRYRTSFVMAIGLVFSLILLNWSTFTSADRHSGGVGSAGELYARINSLATALWAFTQKPITGWGIGRFHAVNTYHHQQFSPDIPWVHGFSEVSHLTELGILAELGLVGILLWLSVLVLLIRRLWRAYRELPVDDMCGRPLALTAIMGVAVLLVAGLTIDLRFVDFPTATVFLLVGVAIGHYDRYLRSKSGAVQNTKRQGAPRG